MKGFTEHVIATSEEVENQLEMDLLNESEEFDELNDFDFDDEFANEEEPGELGGNVDGYTNLDIDDFEDEYEEHSSDESDDLEDFEDLEEFADLDESCCDEDEDLDIQSQQRLQQYYGIEDEDMFELNESDTSKIKKAYKKMGKAKAKQIKATKKANKAANKFAKAQSKVNSITSKY